ncbi:MAG: DUF4126 domain-containing protein [Pseudomonadota bacterium]|nr:DUF4126 domain-containing protein [Pseudomonadota bacterium]
MPTDTTHLIALAAALGWASGLRLWAVLLLTGGAGALGWIALPPGLHILENPFVLAATGTMAVVEFLADKIPALDSIWDALQTLVRIPGGALLAAGVFGGDNATWVAGAALLGAALAANSHVAKTSLRAAVNTSPEPFSNIALSLLGDAAVPTALWLASAHPIALLILVGVAAVVMATISVLLIRFLRALVGRLRGRSAAPMAAR